MAIRIVQSKQNARVKELRALLLHPGPGNAGLVAVEGLNLVAEALRSGLKMRTIFVAQGFEHLVDEIGAEDAGAGASSAEILALPFDVLASAVSTESPQPIAAIVEAPAWNWDDLLLRARSGPYTIQPLIVVVAGIQDPGNLGTILRSAEAFGATGAVCLPGTVSPWNPKALRASAGSAFRLPMLAASEAECFQNLQTADVRTLAAMAHEASPLGEHDLSAPVAVVIGPEGSGLSSQQAGRCDARATIPCPGPVESLNAAVAASILLYEASRQRAKPASKTPSRPSGAQTTRRESP